VVWPVPGDPSWAAVHTVWAVLLTVPLLALAVANRELR